MASTYSTNTGIELQGSGENANTWGDITNTNFTIIDRALNGVGAITLSGTTHTLTTSDGSLSDGQYAVLVFGGSPSGTNTVTISPNDQDKLYHIQNSTNQSIILKQGSGATITVAAGLKKIVYADGAGSGAAVVDLTSNLDLGDITATSLDISGSVDIDGTLETDALSIASTTVTATAAELNKLDACTATTAELNYLDLTTLGTSEASKVVSADASGDITIAGASYNAVWDKSANALEFADNAKAVFGTGSDMELSHDASHSYIKNTTGSLKIQTGQLDVLGGSDGGETMATFVDNGAVSLYYDNSVRLATTSAGASLTGAFTASGDITAFSDERLKTNIKTIPDALSTVQKMRGVTFTKDNMNSSGVIAQELEKVAPELVHSNEIYKSVAYGNLVGYLIEAVKELSEKVEALEHGI